MAATGALFAVGVANAITFSNFSITGQTVGLLNVDHFINTGVDDVDVTFNQAIVGDSLPFRQDTIVITFEAKDAMPIKSVGFSFTNVLLGSGLINYQEIVEDFAGSGIIASYSHPVVYAPGGPQFGTIVFDRPSTHIKVKKTFFLFAPDSTDVKVFDLAGIGLVEQKFELVPEPASMAALGVGVAALIARRRRKA